MLLIMDNARTSIQGADVQFLNWLDQELRYNTSAFQEGIEPGDEYFQTDGWDGWVRFLHRPKTMLPWFPTGLISIVRRLITKYRYTYEIEDRRERPQEGFPELVNIPLREYQRRAVDRAVKLGRGVLDMVPRSGKTRCACELQRCIALPTIWIAPTSGVVTQTKRVLDGFFGDWYSYQLVGSKGEKVSKAMEAPVVVCTAATAVNLPGEFYQTRGCIIVDEFHHASSSSFKTIFRQCNHIYYRYGLTGTFFRSDGDDMAMHAHLSETIYKVDSEMLLSYGHLVPTKVVFLPILQKMPRSKSGPMPKEFIRGHGKYGIHEFEYRNLLVAYCAQTLNAYGYKVLVLVGTKKQGRLIQSEIKKLLPAKSGKAQFDLVEFVSTDVDRRIQQEIIKAFVETDEVRILLGTSLLGEGVDLPSVDALVYARAEKAAVSLTQSAYRVCTASEGKTHAVIVDFADRHHKKLLQHSQERLEVYYQEPIFDVDILDEPGQFNRWLDQIADGDTLKHV